MSFTEVDEVKLIKSVASHPVLYDVSDPDYRNIVAKEYVWKAIGKDLKKHSIDCKKKWKAIRDGYHRFKKRHNFGTDAPKNSKDKRHLLLSFLDGVPDRTGGSNIPPSSPESNVNDLLMVTLEEQELSKDGTTSFAEEDSDNDDMTNAEVSNQDKTNSVVQKKAQKNDRREKRHTSKNHKSVAKKKRKDDDIDLFTRHIGEVLRKLPQLEKAKAKKHLYLVLSDYEIMAAKNGSMRGSSSSVSDTSTPPNSPGATESADPLYQPGPSIAPHDDDDFDT